MTDRALGLIKPEHLDPAGLQVIHPADGSHITSVRLHDIPALTAIIERADAARREWAARTAKERSDVLRAWYNLIIEKAEDLARLMTLESGKPLDEARGEVKYGAAFIEWFAEEARRAYGEVIPSHAAGKRIVTLRPADHRSHRHNPQTRSATEHSCSVAIAATAQNSPGILDRFEVETLERRVRIGLAQFLLAQAQPECLAFGRNVDGAEDPVPDEQLHTEIAAEVMAFGTVVQLVHDRPADKVIQPAERKREV
jgi:hypothetical protein